MRGPDAGAPHPQRVLVLSTPSTEPPPLLLESSVEVGRLVLGASSPGTSTPVRRVGRGLRRAALTGAASLTRGQPPGAVWRLVAAGWRGGEADLVVSTSPATDGLAAVAARLAGASAVATHEVAGPAVVHVSAVQSLLSQVDAAVASGGRRPPPPAQVRRLRTAAEQLLAGCPAPLVPVDLVAASARSWVGALPHQRAAELVADAFGGLDWPEPGAGASGLRARLEWARLSTETDLRDAPVTVARAARAAVDGSAQAHRAGRTTLALDRWCDAWELVHHRELHTDVEHSPLVEDPAGWAGLLTSSPVPGLLARPARPRPHAPTPPRPRPRVLVATGLSGSFHQEVVEALAPAADVEVLDVVARFPRLRRRGRPSRSALEELAALRGLSRDPRGGRRARRLRRVLADRDVVFSDWADASTVWLSYLCPPETRLVVRVHSVDALDAWFPLVDWRNVDEVVVIAPAVGSLVTDLLAAAGGGPRVTLLPGLVGVDAMGAGKEPGARTTLGMVGWSRRVKDVAWALDLLERDPAWRLLLVGEPLTEPRGSARGQEYGREVLRRLEQPHLRDRVEVTGYTDDVPAVLRRVGVILSTSRREGNHHGLVEGAASGAVPVVRNWPLFADRGGARAVYPPEWVVDDLDAAVARVRACTADEATWERCRLADREQALALFDPRGAAARYRETVLGPGAGAPEVSPAAGCGSRG